MSSAFFSRLLHRRVPQILGIYLAVGWGIVEFVDWVVKRYLLSSTVTDIALVAMLSLAPAAALLAYTHGAPGKDGWGRAEKVGIPLNLVATSFLLVTLFHGKEVGATTEQVVVTDAEGQTTERQVPKAAFRRKVALFFWTNQSGDAELDWLQYGFPLMLAQDLGQDPYIQVGTLYGYEKYLYSRLQRAGYDDGLNVPVALQRQAAKANHLPFFVDGEISKEGPLVRATVTLYRTSPARRVAERSFTGGDPPELVDQMARQIKDDLEIPAGSEQLASDLPVTEHMSDSREAIADYVAGLNADLLESDDEQAIAAWQRAVERDPSFALAHLRLAETFMGVGRVGEARATLADVVQHDYKLTERNRFMVKGLDYLVKGEFEKRTSLFEMWTELYPDDIAAYGHLADAYIWWENRIDDAIAIYRKIYEIDPSADWVLQRIATLLSGQGRSEEAIEHIRRYAELHPDEHVSFVNIGQIYENAGELEPARENYEKANVLSSGVVYPTIALSRIDLKEGRVDAAVERLRDAETIAVSPQQESLVLRARLESARVRGRLEEAVDLLPVLSEIESTFKMPLDVMIEVGIFLSELYVLAGRLDEAIARLEAMSSRVEPPFDAFFNLGFMQAYLAAEDPDQAAVYHEKAVAFANDLDRKDIRIYTELAEGRIRELRGEYSAAVGAYETALETYLQSGQSAGGTGQEVDLLTALGRAHRLAGDREAAEEHLRKALRLFPSYPEAHLELARLHEALGDTAASRSHLEAALEIWSDADPAYPPARAARSLYAGQVGPSNVDP